MRREKVPGQKRYHSSPSQTSQAHPYAPPLREDSTPTPSKSAGTHPLTTVAPQSKTTSWRSMVAKAGKPCTKALASNTFAITYTQAPSTKFVWLAPPKVVFRITLKSATFAPNRSLPANARRPDLMANPRPIPYT